MLAWSGEVEEGAQLRPWVLSTLLHLEFSLLTPGLGFFSGAKVPGLAKSEVRSFLLLHGYSYIQ